MAKPVDYYKLLGISIFANDEEIRNGYLKKVKQYHPDTYKGNKDEAEDMTAEINVAYSTLKDSEKRHFYDVKNGFEKLRQNIIENQINERTIKKRFKQKNINTEKKSQEFNNKSPNKESQFNEKTSQNEFEINMSTKDLKKKLKSMRRESMTAEQKKFKKERLALDAVIIGLVIIVVLLIVFHK